MLNGSSSSGPIDIDLTKQAVAQLWDTVHGILSCGTNIVQLFLKVSGSEVYIGLSPFAVDRNTRDFQRNINDLGLSAKYSLIFCPFHQSKGSE
jgi:hypothetical protein